MRRRTILVLLAVVAFVVIGVGGILVYESVNGSLFDDPPDAPSSGPCRPSDFRVEKVAVSVVSGFAKLTGNVVSNCSQASGVELRWTATRDDGTIAFSHTFWPASISNIPAKSTYPFDFSWAAPSGHFSSKVEAFRTTAW